MRWMVVCDGCFATYRTRILDCPCAYDMPWPDGLRVKIEVSRSLAS
jgi:hypothetical protein